MKNTNRATMPLIVALFKTALRQIVPVQLYLLTGEARSVNYNLTEAIKNTKDCKACRLVFCALRRPTFVRFSHGL
jgi:hypothetical protein